MDKLTYRQAYDKIIQAYFKDEIKPNDLAFCFCGTLQGSDKWYFPISYANILLYTGKEYKRMEHALFEAFEEYADQSFPCFHVDYNEETIPDYEERLFKGMSAALDVLKEIHRSRGENVDEVIPAFTKRELAKAL